MWSVHVVVVAFLALFCVLRVCHSQLADDDDERDDVRNDVKVEKRLKDALLKDYDKQLRPVINVSDAVPLRTMMYIRNIKELDEVREVLTLSVWFRMVWQDQHMVWDPTKYSNITSIRLASESLWRPDIYLYNNAHANIEHFPTKMFITIRYNGRMSWAIPVEFRSYCPVDLSDFPFDSQRCVLTIGSWAHHGWEIALSNVTYCFYSQYSHQEWEITRCNTKMQSVTFGSFPEPFQDLKFIVDMMRHSAPYVKIVVLPCIAIEAIALASFFLCIESRERITMAMLNLVVLAILNMDMTAMMPVRFSNAVPIIVAMYDLTFFMLVLSLLMSVVVLALHHRVVTRSMPAWTRLVFIQLLARVLLVDTTGVLQRPGDKQQLSSPEDATVATSDSGSDEKEALDAIQREWKLVARVFDRLMFVAFFTCFFIGWCVFGSKARR
ncbi:PREDICTED: neuronal acetylcholine receptor subunit alpha-9-like [Priapulus caudatus]|uniref:Neuronal acetylcholine receptor subunit alpha-9-like n=1 Tax=Priapulus caudatus TaxID=37621 RepID=A0ABM1EDL5_PRICU|nr:PREDICTED: neuronal acetylcholine receptor subunit alpha-9-like [Priapulus caudatus]